MKAKQLLNLTFMLLLLGKNLFAQAGGVDTTFAHPVLHLGDSTRIYPSSSAIRCMIVQPDKKYLVGGNFTKYNGITRNRIMRLNVDGNYDSTGFIVATGFSSGTVYALALQKDQKILAGGDFTTYNSQPRNGITRINSNGTLDNSFSVPTGFNSGSAVYSIALQPNKKILVGGSFTTYNGIDCKRIVRLYSDGTIDNTFNIGIGFNGDVNSIVYDTINNKIIIGGKFTTYNGSNHYGVVMLDSTGIADAGFITSTSIVNVNKVTLQSNGQIIIGGDFTKKIARLNSDGSVDNSFDIGTGFNRVVSEVAIDSMGNILVGGNFTLFNGVAQSRFCQLTNSGILDDSFKNGVGTVGSFDASQVYSIVVLSGRKILVGGNILQYNNTYRSGILRLNSNGLLDNSFNVVFGFTGLAISSGITTSSIAILPDGKVLVGGDFERYNGTLIYRLIRLDTSGNIDTTFHSGFSGTSSVSIQTVIADTINHKIYVGGSFTKYDNISRSCIARLNWDGTLDNAFNVGVGFAGGLVYSMILQPDGNIVVGGSFSSYDGISRKGIARLDSSGTLDLTFNIGTGFGFGYVKSIALQADNKIIAGGYFSSYNGTNLQNIARINPDGFYDNTFVAQASVIVNDILIQPDKKILIGAGTNGEILKRVDETGSNDATFNILNTIANINKIILQPDNRIIIGVSSDLLRLNADGTKDNSFTAGLSNNTIGAIALQKDGKIIAGGSFTKYNQYFSNRIIRLNGGKDISVSAGEKKISGRNNFYPNPTSGKLTITINESGEAEFLKVYDITGRELLQMQSNEFKNRKQIQIDISSLSNALYNIVITNANGAKIYSQKIIKTD